MGRERALSAIKALTVCLRDMSTMDFQVSGLNSLNSSGLAGLFQIAELNRCKKREFVVWVIVGKCIVVLKCE